MREPLLSLKSGGPRGARGDVGTEQKKAFVEDGDAEVLMPSVNEMLWGSQVKKKKGTHKITNYH